MPKDINKLIQKKKDIDAIVKQLIDNREPWEPRWKDIRDYIIPSKGRYDGDTNNILEDNDDKVINKVATKSLTTLAGGMQSGMASPSRPWLKFIARGLEGNYDASSWLFQVEQILLRTFHQTNFYNVTNSVYKEECAFGIGAMFMEEGLNEKPFIFTAITNGTYAIGLGKDGVCDTFYRNLWLPARVIISLFGIENVSMTIENALKDAPDKYFEVKHLVYPRKEYDVDKVDNMNMPIASVYWDPEDSPEKFLKNSGFREFPAFTPRWDPTAGDVYSEGPGHLAIGLVKLLQTEIEANIGAKQKGIEPPMVSPGGVKGQLDLRSGANNISKGVGGGDVPKPLFDVPPVYIDIVDRMEARHEQGIREFFYVDLFTTPTDLPQMTATEVLARRQEKLLQLGPVVERQHQEFFDPVVKRAFNIMLRKGLFPPIPQILQGAEIEIEYISVLAQAQINDSATAVEGVARLVAGLASTKQEALDVLNTDEVIRVVSRAKGSPPSILNSPEHVNETRKLRADQQAKQEGQQDAMIAAENAKVMSDTSTEGGTLLSAATGE